MKSADDLTARIQRMAERARQRPRQPDSKPARNRRQRSWSGFPNGRKGSGAPRTVSCEGRCFRPFRARRGAP